MNVKDRVLDRRVPTDFSHIDKYPGRALRSISRTVARVEKILTFPTRYTPIYNQGEEGACVGFGSSILMSILNRKLYDALWLYREAQIVDEWPNTPPEGGTSLRAAFDVLRDQGHRQLWAGASKPPKIDHGIVDVNRWLTTVDEIRTAVSAGQPVLLGIEWHYEFYVPRLLPTGHAKRKEGWFARPGETWKGIAGGHCICLTGASDRRDAVQLSNSWGPSWGVMGKAWMPYASLQRLLQDSGEAAIVTDR